MKLTYIIDTLFQSPWLHGRAVSPWLTTRLVTGLFQYVGIGNLREYVSLIHINPITHEAQEERREASLGHPAWGENDIPYQSMLLISMEDREDIREVWQDQNRQWGPHFNFHQYYWQERYSYDQDGNRILKENANGNIPYLYEDDRLVQRGLNRISYDNNGNQLAERGPNYSLEFGYDDFNRQTDGLSRTRHSDRYIQYEYDALGRRISREERVTRHDDDDDDDDDEDYYNDYYDDYFDDDDFYWNSMTENYHYSGLGFTMNQRTVNHQQNRHRVRTFDQSYYHANGDVLAFTGLRNSVHYSFSDYQGTVLGYTGRHGIQMSYQYDAFGNPIMKHHDEINVLGYNGKVYDWVTEQYNYGYRDYAPWNGQFTTVDPIKDGLNWYVYCSSNPINYIDTLGLSAEDTGLIPEDYTVSIGNSLSVTNPIAYNINFYSEMANGVQDLILGEEKEDWFETESIDQVNLSGGVYIDSEGIGIYGTYGTGVGTPELIETSIDLGLYNVDADVALDGNSVETGGGIDVPVPETLGIVSAGAQGSIVTTEQTLENDWEVLGVEGSLTVGVSPSPVDVHSDIETAGHIELFSFKE